MSSSSKRFSSIVSLGFFCSVAIDSRDLGKRQYCFPFDWLITDFEKTVIKLITNKYKHFFQKKDFIQDEKDANHFYNKRYNYWIYHDFIGYIPLRYQFHHIKLKYKRRVKRLKKYIAKECCLYIRYCENQEEINYIVSNIDTIKRIFGNNGSNIIFICNDEENAPDFFYTVKRKSTDVVNRRPLYSNERLKDYIVKNVENTEDKKTKIYKLKEMIYNRYLNILKRKYYKKKG